MQIPVLTLLACLSSLARTACAQMGPLSLLVIGLVAVHCMRILVKCAQDSRCSTRGNPAFQGTLGVASREPSIVSPFSPGKEQAAGVWETCLAPGW